MVARRKSRRRMLLVGGAVLALACVAVVSVLMHLSSGTPGDRKQCAENLRAIGQACISYANANQGNFPRSLRQLLRANGGTLRPDQITCPNAGKKRRGGDYVYVQGYRITDDPNAVLVYEPPDNHKRKPGGHVLLLSGVVNWRDKEQLAEAIAQLKARQATPMTGR
ncbi:MAG TPA: hypothetical protein PLL20_15320 [Phycisphaerae bacterium]|nr:hypothetical protein [Phycisphaerae bacterium]HRR84744.1 hypothetical protein [Phycisphaerae bacterium]